MEASSYPSFALCVANRESGEPGSTSAATVRWNYDDGTYEGAFNWVHSTWTAQGGSGNADEASPAEQVRVFMAHANPHDWPQTVPACGG